MRQLLSLTGAIAVLLSATVAAHADSQTDAKAIIEQAVKAHGADNLNKFKAQTSQMKGKFYGQGDGIDYTGLIEFQSPDKLRVEIESEIANMKFKFTKIVNKDKGWTGLNDKLEEMDKDTIAEEKENQHAGAVVRLLPAAFKEAKLSPLGEIKVNEKPTVGVRVEVKGYRDVNLYFDKETNLLVKSETRGKDVQNGGAEFTNETYFGDYKKVDGVQLPHKINVNHDGKKFVESEVTEVKNVEKIDDSQFAKP